MRCERGHTRRGAIGERGAVALALAGALAWVAPARAQEPPPLEAPALPAAVTPAPAPAPQAAALDETPRGRPRLSAAVGMGLSLDDSGLMRTEAIPSFFATGGVGVDWPVGFDLGAFSSAAQGRYTGTAMDRLALDAFGVVRPFAWSIPAADPGYRARLVRATGVELGLGLERDGTTTNAGTRFGLHTGARFEVPLGLPGYASELRLRLAARYMVGFYTPRVLTVDVGNSVELYAALVSVF
ncbi:MAG TPA: hypothetical protein VHL80_18585 [Polyangia bacterium]|nr:hypothetical protein [Polyangia bacterium]